MSRSNFRFIARFDPDPILKQVYDNWGDWKMIAGMGSNIGGDKNPLGFLPLTMGVQFSPEHNIKDSELQKNTPVYSKYTEIIKFLNSHGITKHNRAAFFKLPVGGKVLRHIDDGSYYLTKDRYHVSLQGKYRYCVGDECHVIEPGTFFWFNNKIPHDAENVGDNERITFVFDTPHSENNP